MGVVGGIFNIIQRGQLNAAAQASQHVAQKNAKRQPDSSSDPLTWTFKKNESAVASFWRLDPNAAAKTAPSLDTVKRLEKMADGGNSDISAEKIRQAKVKLDGLRRQLQMLAASGDVRQLRRIAAEAASLAREIGVAARSIAQGIGAGTVSSDATTAQATASAATAAAQSAPNSAGIDSVSADVAAVGGNKAGGLEQSYKALHELGSDARKAVLQAKGIIALAAQIARGKRRGSDDEEEDRYFHRLQDEADAALDDIDTGQREALGQLVLPQGSDAGGDILDMTSLEITVETITVSETRVEVFA
jgi:hypothetical protein